MEPPAKRRRRGLPPASRKRDADDNSNDNDDELASHPQEITVRRDPDIRFALKRAKADHKLQATMAHIIEKYSHNFDGVGDEIDMETGEIIVDNGHISNMRDEGDVGNVWRGNAASDEDDEDEGILLEDLTNEHSDDEDINRSQDSDSQNERETNAELGDSSLTSNTHPQADSTPTTTRDSNHKTGEQHRHSPPRNPQLGISTPSNPQPSHGPLPFGYNTPSYGFGLAPGGFGPWGMLPGYMMQAWGRDDVPPYMAMPPSRPIPGLEGGRYEFPAQNEYTSVWGQGRSRRTKKAGTMRGVVKTSASSVGKETVTSNQGEQGHDIPADASDGSGGRRLPQDGGRAGETVINLSDEDDDLDLSSLKPTSSPDKALEVSSGNVLKEPPTHSKQVIKSRRRSGPSQSQVQIPGRISQRATRTPNQRSGQTLTIRFPRVDPRTREEYKRMDDTAILELDLAPGTGQPNSDMNMPSKADVRLDQVIPDSQDTATPFNSSAPQASPQSTTNTNKSIEPTHDFSVSMDLSDDEAPLLLSKLNPVRGKTTVKAPISRNLPSSEPAEQDSVPDHNQPHSKLGQEQPAADNVTGTEGNLQEETSVDKHATDSRRPGERESPKSRPSSFVDSLTNNAATASTLTKPQTPIPTQTEASASSNIQLLNTVKKPEYIRRRPRQPRVSESGNKTSPGTDRSMGSGKRATRYSSRRTLEADKPLSDEPVNKAADDSADIPVDEPMSEILNKSITVSDPQTDLDTTPTTQPKVTEIPSSLSQDDQLPPLPPKPLITDPSATPKRRKDRISRPAGTPSSNPHTPRHASIRTSHAPSSRRSLLSFVSDDSDSDELVHAATPASQPKSARSVTHKLWRSTTLTTEVHRTPSRRHRVAEDSPGNMVKTPGGTVRTCGLDGYDCGRDFCFACL